MTSSPAELDGGTCRLELAADLSLLATARLFSAAVARQAGCDETVVEDVKLAVSEACTAGAEGAGPGRDLTIETEERDGSLVFVVTTPAHPGARSSDPDMPSHLDLISGLFPGALEEPSAGAWSLTFRVPVDQVA